MCGIIGMVNFHDRPADAALIRELTQLIAHRGPDGEGHEVEGPVSLGHRRLSIIDPSRGRQPMFNEDRSIWITFNGEIYNFKELRLELVSKGHRFHTSCDTEAIIHAYEEWGEACVERFRGMFAFGIVDWRKRQVFVARDHLGIKPLYYMLTPDHFAFCSEFHPLAKIPGVNLSLDLSAIDEYLWLQYIPAPKTAVNEIRKLLPAQRMTVGFDGSVKGPEEYWTLNYRPNYYRSQAELLESLDEILEDSVRAHLMSDVPFGVFLSGGVDSSLVLAYMTKILGKPVKAFSIGFDEADFNEVPYAKAAAERYGAEHHVEMVKPDALGILPDLVRHYGEPFGDSSAVPTYYVSQVARKYVPMVLSGDGADESFAGYWSHRDFMIRFAQADSRVAADYTQPRIDRPYGLRGPEPTLADWLSFIQYIPVPDRLALWKPELRQYCPAPIEVFRREFGKTGGYSLCNKVQYTDQKTYLPYDILTKVDIASMMNGLEARVPFVDLRVIEFAATIPERYSIGVTAQGEWERKLLLKKLGEKYYPPEFLYRPKMGFAVPIAKWFAPGGELHGAVREILLRPNSITADLFDQRVISAFLDQGRHGPVWLLLFLDEWFRQNI